MNSHYFHHLKNELILMAHSVASSSGVQFWQAVGVLAFSAVFLVVGLTRFVEFQGLGISSTVRRSLIAVHVVGTILFVISMTFFGLDTVGRHTKDTGYLFGASMLLLLPTHIYINLLRRVKLRKLESQS